MTFLGPNTVTVLWCAGFAIVVLGVGGIMTDVGPWYRALRMPSWQPPAWLFGPVWTAIGILSVWGAVVAWDAATDAQQGTIRVLFVVNGLLNVGWSLLFFKLRRPAWAVIEVVPLWLSVLALVVVIYPIAPMAGLLLLPYLIWVAFAAFLNLTIVKLNTTFKQPAGKNQ